jgi:hypothetical protein
MKSQQEIVEEAIKRLEAMSREEFLESLVKAELAEPEE